MAVRRKRGAVGKGNGEVCPPPQPTRRSGGASLATPAGSGAEPRPKTNLVTFVAARRTLIATICLISVSLNTAVVHSHNCRTPRRNASLAFRLKRLQKFRYGVPPFQKVPVWRSGAFRLSSSTGLVTITVLSSKNSYVQMDVFYIYSLVRDFQFFHIFSDFLPNFCFPQFP